MQAAFLIAKWMSGIRSIDGPRQVGQDQTVRVHFGSETYICCLIVDELFLRKAEPSNFKLVRNGSYDRYPLAICRYAIALAKGKGKEVAVDGASRVKEVWSEQAVVHSTRRLARRFYNAAPARVSIYI